jgi:hypothetical protein
MTQQPIPLRRKIVWRIYSRLLDAALLCYGHAAVWRLAQRLASGHTLKLYCGARAQGFRLTAQGLASINRALHRLAYSRRERRAHHKIMKS